MLLYHGTSEAYLQDILRDGLKPRGKSKPGNWKDGNISMPYCVYLSDTMAPYFATWCQEADTKSSFWKGGGHKGLLIEVDTERLTELLLLPDEDVLRIALAAQGRQDEIPGKRAFRKWMDLMMANQNLWKESINTIGTCAHLGPIPPGAITRYALFERDAEYAARFDNSVNPTAHKIRGEKSRRLIKLMFDGEYTVSNMDFLHIERDGNPYWPLHPDDPEYQEAAKKYLSELLEHRNKTVEVVTVNA